MAAEAKTRLIARPPNLASGYDAPDVRGESLHEASQEDASGFVDDTVIVGEEPLTELNICLRLTQRDHIEESEQRTELILGQAGTEDARTRPGDGGRFAGE